MSDALWERCKIAEAALRQRDERIEALEKALKGMLQYCPLSGDMALMIRACQSGGQEAAERANTLVVFYSHLDEAQDQARAALEAK